MILSLLLSTQVFAFTFFGPYSNLAGFNVDDLYIYLNPSSCPQNFSTTLTNAISTWNQVPMSRLTLHFGGSTTATASDLRTGNFEERVVIACSTNFETDSQDQNGDGGCTGTCLSQVYARAGVFTDNQQRLLKSYIVINMNPSAQARLSQLSLSQQEVVVAHELGHTLGLGHSNVPEALMHAYISNKNEALLDDDDQLGMAFLYPYDTPLGCGSMKASAPWFLLLFLLPMFLIYLFKTNNVSRYRKPLQKNS